MTKSESKRNALLTASLIIAGLIATISAAVLVVNLKSTYVAWDRGKPGMPRLLKQTEVRIDDLPALVAAMARGTGSVRYAAFMFSAPDRPTEKDVLNLQISIENGTPGFDWVLLAPRNIEDQDKFKAFARAHGVEPVVRSENGVSYFRIEHTDAAKFARSVITGMYHYPSDEPLGLVYEGFDWSPS